MLISYFFVRRLSASTWYSTKLLIRIAVIKLQKLDLVKCYLRYLMIVSYAKNFNVLFIVVKQKEIPNELETQELNTECDR